MAGLELPENLIGWGPPFIRGRFEPVRRDDLRPQMAALIGKELIWEFAGISGDDEPYPGQKRYHLWPTADIPQDAYYVWAPLQDIVVLSVLAEEPERHK